MRRFRSQPLDLAVDREDITRADLVFYGVDHSGPSYEARIFLDNPRASADTRRDIEKGYAGSFTVSATVAATATPVTAPPRIALATSSTSDRRTRSPPTPAPSPSPSAQAHNRRAGHVNVVAVPRESKDTPATTEIPAYERIRLLAYQD